MRGQYGISSLVRCGATKPSSRRCLRSRLAANLPRPAGKTKMGVSRAPARRTHIHRVRTKPKLPRWAASAQLLRFVSRASHLLLPDARAAIDAQADP